MTRPSWRTTGGLPSISRRRGSMPRSLPMPVAASSRAASLGARAARATSETDRPTRAASLIATMCTKSPRPLGGESEQALAVSNAPPPRSLFPRERRRLDDEAPGRKDRIRRVPLLGLVGGLLRRPEQPARHVLRLTPLQQRELFRRVHPLVEPGMLLLAKRLRVGQIDDVVSNAHAGLARCSSSISTS